MEPKFRGLVSSQISQFVKSTSIHGIQYIDFDVNRVKRYVSLLVRPLEIKETIKVKGVILFGWFLLSYKRIPKSLYRN